MSPLFRLPLIVIFVFVSFGHVRSQILISILFGDALNSEKVEFGLKGGINRSYLHDVPEANGLNNFNLGFYFHLYMKKNAYLSTGLMVKGTVGASGMNTYTIGNNDFDALMENGSLTKKINYFYLPVMYQQRFNQRWYIEGGIMSGLRTTARDIFSTKVLDGDLEYNLKVSDQYTRLDFGMIGGVGYKFQKRAKSTALGMNYYHGLANVSKIDGSPLKNSFFNLYVKIPIMGAKAKKEPAE
jgi:hypothetical protein